MCEQRTTPYLKCIQAGAIISRYFLYCNCELVFLGRSKASVPNRKWHNQDLLKAMDKSLHPLFVGRYYACMSLSLPVCYTVGAVFTQFGLHAFSLNEVNSTGQLSHACFLELHRKLRLGNITISTDLSFMIPLRIKENVTFNILDVVIQQIIN